MPLPLPELGLLLLIVFITVNGSGMRGKSSVIPVCRYLLLPPIERKPGPSDALEEWRWGRRKSDEECSCEISELSYRNCTFITNQISQRIDVDTLCNFQALASGVHFLF